ncbi:unnamed protein product [Arctia plantaginis]|uniref:Uncharacterized protein n=1 Tax=Arctia plantaginis TaxID=874455 RepID=A0A8S0Z9T5_ARCPL|nr:unnamed protein product [Arctia plantaginis]
MFSGIFWNHIQFICVDLAVLVVRKIASTTVLVNIYTKETQGIGFSIEDDQKLPFTGRTEEDYSPEIVFKRPRRQMMCLSDSSNSEDAVPVEGTAGKNHNDLTSRDRKMTLSILDKRFSFLATIVTAKRFLIKTEILKCPEMYFFKKKVNTINHDEEDNIF